MNTYKLLPAMMVAAVVAMSTSAVMAVPVIGAPINGTKSLNANIGNFDVAIGTHAGSKGAQIGNGTWSTGTNTEITNVPSVWVANDGGVSATTTDGLWISFADSGDGGVVVGNASPAATYTFSFTTGNTMAHLGLWAYGDDTAEVFISGGDIGARQIISLAANTSQDNACANGEIGCEPGEDTFSEVFFLSALTTYNIEVDAFQIGSGPFGILLAGGLMNVPEPGTLALLGLGILGLGVARRRRKAA